jgi:hypothetical protein
MPDSTCADTEYFDPECADSASTDSPSRLRQYAERLYNDPDDECGAGFGFFAHRKVMKWLWVSFGVVLAAVAMFFLWPTVEWYLFIPAPEKTAALGSLSGLRESARRKEFR